MLRNIEDLCMNICAYLNHITAISLLIDITGEDDSFNKVDQVLE